SGFVDIIAGNNRNAFRFRQVDSTEQEYFRSNANENELSLKFDSYFRLSKSNGLSTGIGIKRIGNDNTTTFADTIFDRNGRQVPLSQIGLQNIITVDTADYKAASYAQFEQKFANKFEIHLGVRGDYYNFIEEKFHPSARFSAIAHLSNRTKVKASIGRYEQAPSYVWVLNPFNRQLKPLRNDMVVAGINHLVFDDTNVSFETYYKDYSNLPAGATPDLSYLVLTNTGVGYGGREDNFQSFGFIPLVSEGQGKAYGFELLLQKKLSNTPLYGQVSLAYSKSEYTARNGKTYPGQYDQRFILNISGGYKIGANWEVSGKFRYYTGSPYTRLYLPQENNGFIQNLPEEYLQSRLDAGHLLDLRVDRRFNFARWTLIAFADVQNVYNNLLTRKPRYDFWEQKIIDKAELGILPSVGISAEF
ncbi:MAG: TonB-dependent receptor, partial [Calditrichaeota bacterium]